MAAALRTRDERIAQLEREVFGRTSKKVDPRQTVLFEQPTEEPPEERPPANDPGELAAAPLAKRRGRRRKPDTLRRVDVVHDLSDAEKQALAGEGELVPLGEEITEQYVDLPKKSGRSFWD